MHCLYVHGFASSAQSSKARYFGEQLARHGITLSCPDLNEPDFSTLTITRMVDRIEQEIRKRTEPVVVFGSSLGGFVALHVAARAEAEEEQRIDRLVLLAPAVDFGGNRMRELGDEGITRWRETGTLDVFHYGYNRIVPVWFALYEDAGLYNTYRLAFSTPTLIFQGSRDESVDPATVKQFARGRSNVSLRMLDDDHQLIASLDLMWHEIGVFLGLSDR